MTGQREARRARDPRAAIAEHRFWYHTLEVAPGVTTPGVFDLRPIVERLPWPDVRGKRCLDIGTFDGFFAFELERRGASEVVATDIAEPEQWDWAPHLQKVARSTSEASTVPARAAAWRSPARTTWKALARKVVRRTFTGGNGVPHHAVLARPVG